jgi:hypothetical protein
MMLQFNVMERLIPPSRQVAKFFLALVNFYVYIINMDFTVRANIQTKSRVEFIKVCHVLAKGLTFPDSRPLVISIAGQMDVGKALVADAIINALDENPKIKKYKVPPSAKMSFESEPAQASHFLVRGFIEMDGQKLPVFFVRQHDDLERVKKQTQKGLIFFSDQDPNYHADMVIDLSTKFKDLSGAVLVDRWQRNWDISIL